MPEEALIKVYNDINKSNLSVCELGFYIKKDYFLHIFRELQYFPYLILTPR